MLNEEEGKKKFNEGLIEQAKRLQKEKKLTNKKSPKPEKPIQTSMLNSKNKLYEQIINEEGNAKFVSVDKDGVVKVYDGVGTENGVYVPIDDDSVKEKAVIFPTTIEAFGTTEELIHDIQIHLHKYLDVSDDFEIFASYYVLLSWVYDSITTLPYLRALGDTGTGKSRFLKVIGGICYKPCTIAGAVTPAPIYRMIRKFHGTLIIDEADMSSGDTYNEVIKILNCGFEKGIPVIRCNKDNPDDLEFFDTYCPKIISTRRTFYDKALESRCLNEIMQETDRKDIPAILPKEFFKEQESLRNKLLLFRFLYRNKIDDNAIQDIDLGNIEPRLKQATSSFAVLFVNIPELFKRFKVFIAKYQKDLIEERSTTMDGAIVNTMFELVGVSEVSDISGVSGSLGISASDIYDKLTDQGMKKVTPASVGRHLKALGLRTHFNRAAQKRLIIVDDSSVLVRLYHRYIPTHLPDTPDTTDTGDTKTETTPTKDRSVTEFEEREQT